MTFMRHPALISSSHVNWIPVYSKMDSVAHIFGLFYNWNISVRIYALQWTKAVKYAQILSFNYIHMFFAICLLFNMHQNTWDAVLTNPQPWSDPEAYE